MTRYPVLSDILFMTVLIILFSHSDASESVISTSKSVGRTIFSVYCSPVRSYTMCVTFTFFIFPFLSFVFAAILLPCLRGAPLSQNRFPNENSRVSDLSNLCALMAKPKKMFPAFGIW